jgi:hypothetical protein
MSKTITVHVPMRFAVRGGRKTIISDSYQPEAQPRTKNALLKALAKAHRWRQLIESGKYASISELAHAQRVNESYACRVLRLTLLAPFIVNDLLNGSQNSSPTLKELMKPLPPRWDNQMPIVRSGPAKNSKGEHH